MAQQVLVYVLDQILRLLHPFMPFITEEIWQAIPHEGDFLMKAQWPVCRDELAFPAEEAAMESVMNAIRAVRNRRADLNVPPSRKSHLYVVTEKGRYLPARARPLSPAWPMPASSLSPTPPLRAMPTWSAPSHPTPPSTCP